MPNALWQLCCTPQGATIPAPLRSRSARGTYLVYESCTSFSSAARALSLPAGLAPVEAGFAKSAPRRRVQTRVPLGRARGDDAWRWVAGSAKTFAPPARGRRRQYRARSATPNPKLETALAPAGAAEDTAQQAADDLPAELAADGTGRLLGQRLHHPLSPLGAPHRSLIVPPLSACGGGLEAPPERLSSPPAG